MRCVCSAWDLKITHLPGRCSRWERGPAPCGPHWGGNTRYPRRHSPMFLSAAARRASCSPSQWPCTAQQQRRQRTFRFEFSVILQESPQRIAFTEVCCLHHYPAVDICVRRKLRLANFQIMHADPQFLGTLTSSMAGTLSLARCSCAGAAS